MKIKLSLLVLLFVSGLQGSYGQARTESALALKDMLVKAMDYEKNNINKHSVHSVSVSQGCNDGEMLGKLYSEVMRAIEKIPKMSKKPSILFFHNTPPASDDKPLMKFTTFSGRGGNPTKATEEVSYDVTQQYDLVIVSIAGLETIVKNETDLKILSGSQHPVVIVAPKNLTQLQQHEIFNKFKEMGFFSEAGSKVQEQEKKGSSVATKSILTTDSSSSATGENINKIKNYRYSIYAGLGFGAAALLCFLYCKFAR